MQPATTKVGKSDQLQPPSQVGLITMPKTVRSVIPIKSGFESSDDINIRSPPIPYQREVNWNIETIFEYSDHPDMTSILLHDDDEEEATIQKSHHLEVLCNNHTDEIVETPSNRSRWKCILVVGFNLALALIGMATFLGVSASQSFQASETTGESCAFLTNEQTPNVQMQCACYGEITVISNATLARYELMQSALGIFTTHHVTSCEPQNVALLMLATNDTSQSSDLTLLNRYVLSVLYLAMGGINWSHNNGWFELDGACTCCYFGVTCDGHNVVGIDLQNNNLDGSIPSELGLLTTLMILNLARNNGISGKLPTDLGHLTSLVHLSLVHNSLTGPIPPQFGQLTALQSLDVAFNYLSSAMPSELGILTELETFRIYSNSLSGRIPLELGNLTKLKRFDIGQNKLKHNGPLPIWHVSTLRQLDAQNCGITGSLPKVQLGHMTSLTELYMGFNSITGSIPSELFQLTALRILSLPVNQLQGTLPNDMAKCSSLTEVQLSINSLTGTIPNDMNLSHLVKLDLKSNNLSGSISDDLCRLRMSGSLSFLRTDCAANGNGEIKVTCPYPNCCTMCDF